MKRGSVRKGIESAGTIARKTGDASHAGRVTQGSKRLGDSHES
jgi:hypothetical protein